MDLYLDQLPELEKNAAFAAKLSDSPQNWPQELSSELFRQLPFLSDYEVNVNLERVEAQRGYAFGYADVSNRSERPEEEHANAGMPHIRIPLVVIENGVKPFSVFLDGKRVIPLTEERVREALFNPRAFDISVQEKQNPSIANNLLPPNRTGSGYGGEFTEFKAASVEKLAWSSQGYHISRDGKSVTHYVGTSHKKEHSDNKSWLRKMTPKKYQKDIKEIIEPPSEYDRRGSWNLEVTMPVSEALMHKELGPEIRKELEDWKNGRGMYSGSRAKTSSINKEALTLVELMALMGATGLGVAAYRKYKNKKNSQQSAIKPMEVPAEKKAEITPGQVGAAIATPVALAGGAYALGRHQGSQAGAANYKKKVIQNINKIAADKTAFYHMSKQQWEALYKNPKVQELIQATGSPSDPRVVNLLYELASKHYGFHPKDFGPNPVAQAQKAQGGDQQPKTASLLEAIAPTIRESDVDAFVEKVSSDATIQAGFRRSGIAPLLVDVFDNTKRASAGDHLEALSNSINPTVITFQKLPGGDFLVKSANTDAFAPGQAADGQVVPQDEAAQAVGPENAQAMQPGQTATAVSQPVDLEGMLETTSKVCDEFGQWNVQDTAGNSISGWVFPMTLAWDGQFSPQPISLFTNGSVYAFQEGIAGDLIGRSTSLPKDSPRGDGVFYTSSGGNAICTTPVTIGSSTAGPDGQRKFIGSDLFGHPVTVSFVEGIKVPTRVTDVEYAFPMTWKFMRLNNQTQLVQDPSQMIKTASLMKQAKSSVELIYNGAYHVRGGCGLDKIASKYRMDLSPVSAEFILGVLGVDGSTAQSKMAAARKLGSVKMAGLRTIRTLSERFEESTKTASAFLSKIPDLRRDLVKEAATLEDESTVDKVLALNFINPDNLATFVGYIPELQQSSEKLAEMLLSSYLGLQQIPESSTERAMKNLEEVIGGLKSISYAES